MTLTSAHFVKIFLYLNYCTTDHFLSVATPTYLPCSWFDIHSAAPACQRAFHPEKKAAFCVWLLGLFGAWNHMSKKDPHSLKEDRSFLKCHVNPVSIHNCYNLIYFCFCVSLETFSNCHLFTFAFRGDSMAQLFCTAVAAGTITICTKVPQISMHWHEAYFWEKPCKV